MRRRDDFTLAVRRGQRVGRRRIVVYLYRNAGSRESARVGFIVSRAVGNAVVRNTVRRRLRHAVRERLHLLPTGSLLVVRANPAAATADYHELAAEFDGAFDRLLRRQIKARY